MVNKKGVNMAREWGFKVESSEVDILRIIRELQQLTPAHSWFYQCQLKRKAPIVYSRFRKYIDDHGGCLAAINTNKEQYEETNQSL